MTFLDFKIKLKIVNQSYSTYITFTAQAENGILNNVYFAESVPLLYLSKSKNKNINKISCK